MSAGVVVTIEPDVPVVRLARALATAGLALRHDRPTGGLVIREAPRIAALAPELAALLNRIAAAPRQ